ncbi:MAG: hypothetical protein ACR2GR_00505, partial [Rhodothermales bacterium]
AAATFEATLQGSLDVRLEGEAWLFDRSFLDENDPDLPPGFNPRFMPISASLRAEGDDGRFHDLMFSFFGTAAPELRTYEVDRPFAELPDSTYGNPFYNRPTGEGSLLVSYSVIKGEAVASYLFSSGIVEITEASGERLKGTFTMEAEQVHTYDLGDLVVPTQSPQPGGFGRPAPEAETERLDPPLRISGTFYASKPERFPSGR